MTLKEIVNALGGVMEGDCNKKKVINGMAPLDKAGENEISFLSNLKYKSHAESSKAAAIIVSHDEVVSTSCPLIRVKNPYLAFAKAIELLNPFEKPASGSHSTAVIHSTAVLDKDVFIGPLCVIGKNVVIGKGCIIGYGCIIEDDCQLGEGCHLHSGVILCRKTVLHNRVILQSGAVIGSDGFGYARDENGVYHKIPQIGNVVLEDDVEVGANAAIDRAVMGSTLVRKGTKIDNLVQVAHNVEIGKHTVIAGQAGISGSTKIGDRVMIGGQAGFVGHINIGSGAVITAQAGVSHDVPEGEMWSDTPARPFKKMRRIQAAMMRLPELLKRVEQLEKGGEKNA